MVRPLFTMPELKALAPFIKRQRAQIFTIKFERIIEADVGRIFLQQARISVFALQKFMAEPRAETISQLVKVGDLTGSSLTFNTHERYETTTPYPLQLKPRQYIASVVYQGGFTGVGQGNFCLYYSYPDPDYSAGVAYVPLGCIDTAPQATVPAALAFVPDAPLPPVTPNAISVVGANGDQWKVLSTDDIHGALSVWLCLQKTS